MGAGRIYHGARSSDRRPIIAPAWKVSMEPHLCFVNSLRKWGGAEVWFLETALQLQRRGHRVSIVSQPDAQLYQRAVHRGVPAVAIPIRFDAAPWTLWKLHRYFRDGRVTAVVANLTKDLKAAAVAGRLAGVPSILGTRESDFPLKDKLYYRWYFNTLATGLLTGSRATRDTVLESVPWLRPERVHLLYKGIDLNRFRPAEAWPDSPVVGFVGQLIARKGLPQLMAAWSDLEKRDWPRRPVLRIAGEGPLAGDLASWRQQLRHPEAVEICGFVEDISTFFQGLTLLAMPSLAEGFGLAAAEAGACGLPVIAGRASSLPEIVLHRETGLLVPPGDEPALTRAVAELLEKHDLARALGQAARQRVADNFDREQTLDQLAAITGLDSDKTPRGTPK
jgi:glycosyltransferase involved in cell wall biosynthesis